MRFTDGSAWVPVILPVFKTGGRPSRATVCSTHTHFRHPSSFPPLRYSGIIPIVFSHVSTSSGHLVIGSLVGRSPKA